LRADFTGAGNAPLPLPALQQKVRGFGGRLEPRSIIGAPSLDQ
jgi:hypothetical protein